MPSMTIKSTKGSLAMFIHWGHYSIPGGEWQGRKGRRDAHIQHEFRIPRDQYAALAGQFNPVKFNAEAWVKLAKDAGLGYLVYVSKHHDGFAMFGSPSSDYDITDATPFKRDPLKELADACRREGLVLCVYYSLGRDWSMPGVPSGGWRCNDWDFPEPPPDAQKAYIATKVKPHLRELLTQYGPIGAVWFDTPDQITPEHSRELREFILKLQPDCLINSRIGNNLGDFDIHEQSIPAKAIARPWEACLTLNNHWGFDRNDHAWKSPAMVVRCMVDVASKGGNFLINIGPTGEGEVPAPSIERLHALGVWLAVNGEAIYGSRKSCLPGETAGGMVFQEINPDGSEKNPQAAPAAGAHKLPLPRGWRSTTKPGAIYIHLFDRPDRGTVRIQGIPGNATSARLLADPRKRALDFQQDNNVFTVSLPPDVWDQRTTVLKIEVPDLPAQ
jgi:alpha-L-fucosidase